MKQGKFVMWEFFLLVTSPSRTDSFFLLSYFLKNTSSRVINAIKHAGAEAVSKLE
jgi:hypothetical protein